MGDEGPGEREWEDGPPRALQHAARTTHSTQLIQREQRVMPGRIVRKTMAQLRIGLVDTLLPKLSSVSSAAQ